MITLRFKNFYFIKGINFKHYDNTDTYITCGNKDPSAGARSINWRRKAVTLKRNGAEMWTDFDDECILTEDEYNKIPLIFRLL